MPELDVRECEPGFFGFATGLDALEADAAPVPLDKELAETRSEDRGPAVGDSRRNRTADVCKKHGCRAQIPPREMLHERLSRNGAAPRFKAALILVSRWNKQLLPSFRMV